MSQKVTQHRLVRLNDTAIQFSQDLLAGRAKERKESGSGAAWTDTSLDNQVMAT